VLKHYGLKTLSLRVLLPGPHIGRRAPRSWRTLRGAGRVGVHTWDHVSWQDRVARRVSVDARELTLAVISSWNLRPGTLVHGAAGWQTNRYCRPCNASSVIRLRHARYRPFVPLLDHGAAAVPQLPTTLPTLDELIGRAELRGVDPVDHVLAVTAAVPCARHVFTLHAELEGGAYLPSFERLLRAWQRRGTRLTDLATYAGELDFSRLPRCGIRGRHGRGALGTLALQSQWKK